MHRKHDASALRDGPPLVACPRIYCSIKELTILILHRIRVHTTEHDERNISIYYRIIMKERRGCVYYTNLATTWSSAANKYSGLDVEEDINLHLQQYTWVHCTIAGFAQETPFFSFHKLWMRGNLSKKVTLLSFLRWDSITRCGC